ncbi:hypothetical protein EMCRGX_G030776 [Ephydatia muelleri]
MVPAEDLATEHINNHRSILPGYTLAFSDLKKIDITGSVYSDVLNDRTRFPSFFRVFPNSEGLAFGILSVIKHFNWTRVLFLTQQESLFIKTATQVEQQYEARRINGSYITYIAPEAAYDAIWAIALALNKTAAQLNTNGTGLPTKFDKSFVSLKCYQSEISLTITAVEVFIGYSDYANDLGFIAIGNQTIQTIYPEGVPSDGTPRNTTSTFLSGIVYAYYTFASIGVFFTIGFCPFNFHFRDRRIVKITSPTLNYFIRGGVLMMYIFVIINMIQATTFHAVRTICIIPKDWHLVIIIMAITGIAALILLLGSVVSKLTPSPRLILDKEMGTYQAKENGIQISHYIYTCHSDSLPSYYWFILLETYLGILQIVGIVMAFQSRKIKIAILNDSVCVGTLIYISSIATAAIVVTNYGLDGYLNVKESQDENTGAKPHRSATTGKRETKQKRRAATVTGGKKVRDRRQRGEGLQAGRGSGRSADLS